MSGGSTFAQQAVDSFLKALAANASASGQESVTQACSIRTNISQRCALGNVSITGCGPVKPTYTITCCNDADVETLTCTDLDFVATAAAGAVASVVTNSPVALVRAQQFLENQGFDFSSSAPIRDSIQMYFSRTCSVDAVIQQTADVTMLTIDSCSSADQLTIDIFNRADVSIQCAMAGITGMLGNPAAATTAGSSHGSSGSSAPAGSPSGLSSSAIACFVLVGVAVFLLAFAALVVKYRHRPSSPII